MTAGSSSDQRTGRSKDRGPSAHHVSCRASIDCFFATVRWIDCLELIHAVIALGIKKTASGATCAHLRFPRCGIEVLSDHLRCVNNTKPNSLIVLRGLRFRACVVQCSVDRVASPTGERGMIRSVSVKHSYHTKVYCISTCSLLCRCPETSLLAWAALWLVLGPHAAAGSAHADDETPPHAQMLVSDEVWGSSPDWSGELGVLVLHHVPLL